MLIEVKYFHEKSDQDFESYNKLWNENQERFVYLHTNLSNKQQINSIINNLNDNKDILAISMTKSGAGSTSQLILFLPETACQLSI